MLQAEQTDLLSAVKVIQSTSECISKLRSKSDFNELWKNSNCNETIRNVPHKRRKVVLNKHSQQFMVEGSVGQSRDNGNEDEGCREFKRMYYSTLDAVLGKISVRFSEGNTKLIGALLALDPESPTFLQVAHVQPITNLTNTEIVESEFLVARQFLQTQMDSSTIETWATQTLLKTFHRALEAVPSVITAMKHALTFGASTAMCENSFSTLSNVLTIHRRSMLHGRKAQLIHLAFEANLTCKFCDEWKETMMRKFNSRGRHRLQLY
nr:PREDICTED: uncharacterized protein LOC106706406 [Latimeria chalumnae]|eukprot:XP_014352814.1 PREDICTED: uncharacterized protein LOC106706406 [Latimeria chalumnae]